MIPADDHVTFWNLFFLLLIFIPAVLVWAFAVVDIFRRADLSGGMKALWLAVVIFLPFLGTIVYLIVRPVGPTAHEGIEERPTSPDAVARYQPGASARVEELRVLADLHDRGKLTDEEFAAEKARLMNP
jgi:hypothetical protein